MIEVVEPANAEVMAEVPRAGVEEVDEAVARAKRAFPAWRAVSPGDRSTLLRALADGIEAAAEDLAVLEARNAGKPIGDARGEIAMVVECFRYYSAAPGAPARPDDPGRRRRRHDLPRAARRRRPDRPLELPARDLLVEDRAGARRRQHRRPEAGRADPADRDRAGADRARIGAAGGRAQRRRRAGLGLRAATRRASRRRQDRIHRLDRGRARDRRGRRADDQAGHARARRQVRERRLRRRRHRGRRRSGSARGLRQRRPGLLRALADPRRARGDGRLHGGARGHRQVDASSATRSTRRPRWDR